jgi:hypothetical protein
MTRERDDEVRAAVCLARAKLDEALAAAPAAKPLSFSCRFVFWAIVAAGMAALFVWL